MRKIKSWGILTLFITAIIVTIVWFRISGSPPFPQSYALPNAGRPILTLSGFTDRISDVAFSPDNMMLATADSGAKVALWNLKTGKRHRLFEKSKSEGGITISADGKFLVSAGHKIWDMKTGKLKGSFPGGHKGIAVLESLVYDAKSQKMVPVTTRVPAGITAFSISPKGQFLATASNDRTTEIWDARKGKLRWILKGHVASVESIAFSPDSKILASGSLDRTIKLWDMKTGRLIRTLKGHSDTPRAVSFLLDGQTLASAGQTGELFVWNVFTGQLRQQHQAEGIIPGASFSGNGKRLLVSTSQYGLASEAWGEIMIYDSLTGKALYQLKTAVPDSAALSSDGKLIAVGGVEYSKKYKNGFRYVVQIWRTP